MQRPVGATLGRIVAAALGIALSASAALASIATADARPAAPPFTLDNAAGKPVSLEDYRGRVVVLNFWATWCHGCKQELPWFVRFQKDYGSRGLVVVGASTDADGWRVVTPYLKKKPLNYPVVIANEALTKAYDVQAMPVTVLIDRQGRVAATYVGMIDRAVCNKDIQTLLRETE